MTQSRHLITLLLFTFFLLLPHTAHAATCSWANHVTGNWNDASKWSCGSVPTASDNVIVGHSGVINLTENVQVESLQMNGSVITGSHAIRLAQPLTATIQFGTSELNTVGSQIPALFISTESGAIFRLNDTQLTSSSLETITVSAPQGSNGATILNVGERNLPNLLLLNGNLGTTQSLNVTKVFSWTNGSLNSYTGVATMTLTSGAVMTLANGGLYMPFVNNGSVLWNGSQGFVAGQEAAWINLGSLDIRANEADGMISFGGGAGRPLINRGTIAINTSNSVQFDWLVSNYGLIEVNSGVLSTRRSEFIQYEGYTRLNSANMEGIEKCCDLDNYPIVLYGGALSGSGLITGGIDNRGGTVILDGELTLTNAYRQSISGTLQVTLTNATTFGKMTVLKRVDKKDGGAVLVDGTLIVNAADGFKPGVGDRFPIISGDRANGAFQQSSGNVAPAFSGYAGGNQVFVAEPNNALVVQAKADSTKGTPGGENGYTLAFFNPTTQTLTVQNVIVSLPISFTYKNGSISGVLSSPPFSDTQNGLQKLYFSPSFALAGRERKELRFRVLLSDTLKLGSYPLTVEASVAQNIFKLVDVAVIEIPFEGVASNISISGGRVITQSDIPTILIPRGRQADGFHIRVNIVCPPALDPCGTLRDVYLAQERDGRYVNIIKMEFDPNQNPLVDAASGDAQYGFWNGFIPGAQFYPGSPEKLFPDWDAHRPCIAYDYGGGGGRPLGCVGGGQPIGTPELYDPSGVIRDANTNQPIIGATVSLYRIPAALPDTASQTRDCRTLSTRGGSVWTGIAPSTGVFEQPGFSPAQISPDLNPQITGDDGRYGWNVVTGCWYVTVSAPGYKSKTSALVGVPPEVTDLDMTLEPGETPLPSEQKVYLPVVTR